MPGDTDPRRLEGRSEDSQPRDFFWDSITLYVVGVMMALAAIDVLTEFLRGSTIACLATGREPWDREATEAFMNSFCAASVPHSEFFPAFIAVHAILIAIPHYLWANHYGGNFEFFFAQVRDMDRMRNDETGVFSEKNYIILQQLTRAFTTYKQNWMFILYTLKLCAQLLITLGGFLTAVFFFNDFSDVFLCPRNFNASLENEDSLWPLEDQVTCVFTSMRLFATIRVADLILLALLILCFVWSLIWCGSTHPTELGTGKVASFCFQSSMSPGYYIPKFPLACCSDPFKKIFRALFRSIPFCGAGPHISNNLDFLILKLFRTDSGLGFVFREMQVLQQIKYYNDDDQRRSCLHRWQQKPKMLQDGDIIDTTAIQGCKNDLKWRFTKKSGCQGIYNSTAEPLQPDDILVLPRSLRGAVLGFSSLSVGKKRAVFVTFGSTSLGIPSALARIFARVGVLNFNPYFRQKGDNEHFYIAKHYCSEITELSFPEDILAAEYDSSNDFTTSLEELWSSKVKTIDFMVVGPIESELHLSTVSLCLTKLVTTRFSSDSVLLTMMPKEVSAKSTGSEFHSYQPPGRYFEPLYQKVCLNSLKVQDMNWPPKKPTNNDSLQSRKRSSFDLKLACGDSEGRFEFGLYRFVDPSAANSSTSSSNVQQGNVDGDDGRSFLEPGAACLPVQHRAVEMPIS